MIYFTAVIGLICGCLTSSYHVQNRMGVSFVKPMGMNRLNMASSNGPAGLRSDDYIGLNASGKIKDEAAKLRREAEELEISMREEARAKGIPEEVINQLLPRRPDGTSVKSTSSSSALKVEAVVVPKLAKDEIQQKIGYLNTGDAIRMVSELDRLKSSSVLRVWNSKDLSSASFQANNQQLKSKTNIDPVKLKLDDVGFNYQKVFGGALLIATVLGLSSTFVGGQLGFLLGYSSALFPVLLVGVGSISPALIGDLLNTITYATNAEAKEKYITMNAGKFLAGYVSGLPISRFQTGGNSNTVDFFQIRPLEGRTELEDKKMFATRRFKQKDIARCSIACVAGPVAECIAYGEASGTSPADVNILYELLNCVDPALKPDGAQNHIRWSVVTAYEILTTYKSELARLKDAFAKGLPLEECIAIIEGEATA